MYEEGQGGAQDYVRAYMWYDLAIRAGASYSQEFQDRLPQVLLDREIEEARRLAVDWLRRNPQAMPSTLPRGKQASRTPEAVGAGTGFVVSTSGHVVTNHHVVIDCERVRIRVTGQDREAKTIAWDPALDLALVKIDGWKGPTAFLASRDPRAGDPVVVVGFPLPDKALLAGESTITTGTLSSLVGLAGDQNTFQVTAPIQLGNSGGPILDRTGAVIGIVVAKLNAIAVARATGDLPQNINFGIHRRRVAEFLRAHRVDVRTRDSAREMAVADIGDLAKSFTVPIQCLR